MSVADARGATVKAKFHRPANDDVVDTQMPSKSSHRETIRPGPDD